MNASTICNMSMLGAMAVGLVLAWKAWPRLGWKSCTAYYILRYALVCWSILHFAVGPWGDSIGWNMHGQWMVNDGLFPGRGFCTPYYLGFNALIALATWLWNSPASIAAVFTIAEAAAMALLHPALKVVFGDCIAKRSVILYLTSPVCILCAFATQDEALILLGLAAVLYFSVKSRIVCKYVSAFLAFASTKILSPIYIVAFFIWHRWKGLVVFGFCLAAYWGISYACGVDPFDIRFGREVGMNPIRYDAPVENPLAGNIWYYLPKTPLVVKCLVLFSGIGISGLCFLKTLFGRTASLVEKCQSAIAYTCIIFFTFQILYPMVYHGYMIPVVAICCAMFLKFAKTRLANVLLLCGFSVWQVVFVTKDGSSRLLDMIDPSRIMIISAFMITSVVLCVVCILSVRDRLTGPVAGLKVLFGGSDS